MKTKLHVAKSWLGIACWVLLGAAVVTLVSRCNVVHTVDPVFNVIATAKIDLAVEATAVTPLDPGVPKPLKPVQIQGGMIIPYPKPINFSGDIKPQFDGKTVIFRFQVFGHLGECRYQGSIEMDVTPPGNITPKKIPLDQVLQPCSPGVPPAGPQLQLQPGDVLLSSITPIGASLPAGTKLNLNFENIVVLTDP